VIVRPENVAFITDVSSPNRLPYRTMPSSSIDAWIDQVRKIETLDFEIFAPAHGNVGVKADNTDVLTYLETLRAEVLAGLKAGERVVTSSQFLIDSESNLREAINKIAAQSEVGWEPEATDNR